VLAAVDLAYPALVLDLRPVAALLEEGEDPREVAGLAEDVEVLGGPYDPRVGRDRVGPRQQEGIPDSASSLRLST
jgi:hypothetical protein